MAVSFRSFCCFGGRRMQRTRNWSAGKYTMVILCAWDGTIIIIIPDEEEEEDNGIILISGIIIS